jgi:hypothetical protein
MCKRKNQLIILLFFSILLIAGIFACSAITVYYTLDLSLDIVSQILSKKIIPVLVQSGLLCILLILICLMQMIGTNYHDAFKHMTRERLSSYVSHDSVKIIDNMA